MAKLAAAMPPLDIPLDQVHSWGQRWLSETNEETGKPKKANAFDKHQSVNFASFIDQAFGNAIASMLGGIAVVTPEGGSLLPPAPDCVEVGPARIVGGIRPQNFDAAYRPDGPRIVFDSKTLNDKKSVGKNWQNMINDLATEASTVHTRFPYAIVAFAIIIPKQCLGVKQQADLVRTLERLGSRRDVLDQAHMSEVITFIAWDPETGTIDSAFPAPTSPLRIEKFSETLYPHYLERYKGLPPHDGN